MTRRTYTPEYKAKLVIEVLQGEKELDIHRGQRTASAQIWAAELEGGVPGERRPRL